MVIKCLECNYKCGNIVCLKYHYESCHKDKIDKYICGNITISAICANDFSPWGCSLKNESSSNSGFGSGSGSNSSSSSSSNSISDSVSSSSSSSSSGSGSDSNYNSSSNSDPNPNSNSVPNLNPNPNSNYNSEVLISERDEVLGTPTATQMDLRSCYAIREAVPQIREAVPQIREAVTPMVKHLRSSSTDGRSPIHEVVTPIRNCNKCNYIKPLTDFDESKYTCRSCTSAKVNCPYCTSIVRYDGTRAHVKKQHPNVELTKGFSRNLGSSYTDLGEKTINTRAVSPLVFSQTGDLRICKTTPLSSYTDSCSCKYYNFVSFLINNRINIEKVKENINLLKSIDNLK